MKLIRAKITADTREPKVTGVEREVIGENFAHIRRAVEAAGVRLRRAQYSNAYAGYVTELSMQFGSILPIEQLEAVINQLRKHVEGLVDIVLDVKGTCKAQYPVLIIIAPK